MSFSTIKDNPDEYFVCRGVTYAKLAFYQDIPHHKSNLLERAGNAILCVFKGIPTHLGTAASELGLFTNAYLIYPLIVLDKTKTAFSWVPVPSLTMLQIGACFYTAAIALGYLFRAVGRFTNPEVMEQFYALPGSLQAPRLPQIAPLFSLSEAVVE